jgi:hypothetical protein
LNNERVRQRYLLYERLYQEQNGFGTTDLPPWNPFVCMWKDDLRDEDQDVFKQLGDAKERNFPNANMLFQQMRTKYLPTALQGRFLNNCGCEGCGALFRSGRKIERRDDVINQDEMVKINDDAVQRYKENYFFARLMQGLSHEERKKNQYHPHKTATGLDMSRLVGYPAVSQGQTTDIDATIRTLVDLQMNRVLPCTWAEFLTVKSKSSLLCDNCYSLYGRTEVKYTLTLPLESYNGWEDSGGRVYSGGGYHTFAHELALNPAQTVTERKAKKQKVNGLSGEFGGDKCEFCPQVPENNDKKRLYRDLNLIRLLTGENFNRGDFVESKSVKYVLRGYQQRHDRVDVTQIDGLMNELGRDGLPSSWSEYKKMQGTAGGSCVECYVAYLTEKGLVSQ